MALKAAVCEVNITPPVGVWLAGYAGRPGGCLGIHDELYARALVLDDGISLAAIVSMDLVALDFDLVATVRDSISRRVGIPAERLVLNCSHTHSGPVTRTFRAMGERDELYCNVMVRKVVGAVQQAADMLEPASLRWGRASVQIGVNRRERRNGQTVIGRNPHRPIQPYVDVLRVEHEAGTPMATLFAHATHPVVLGAQNLWITADYPGMACDFLCRVGMGMPMFLQGCAGDINPILRDTFAYARKLGEILGASVVVASHHSEPVEGIPISGTLRTVNLPYILPTMEEAQQYLRQEESQLRQAQEQGAPLHLLTWRQDMVRWAQELVLAVDKGEPKSMPFEIQLLRIGDVRLLAFPAEMFVQYALDFVRQSPYQPTIVLGYTNGCWGYIPTAADYPLGGYEVEVAYRYYGTLMVSPDCERLIRDEVYSLMGIPSADRTPYTVET
ncbi:MAG: neutral/alkaline non-lysosomal ceramidase N-terminal domain-containing protein [Armatimonadota bacterium]|nr:neutral/alkaline non-lysosomal ceramidase N-terminal domain-containing protein [bacterium]MDW8319861.1 neutral/alkaline non-lysosomal ceramidase N-terminal domain-containing protein [Armatimonadota bacterium]